MKKIVSMLLITAFVLSLCACGSSTTSTDVSPTYAPSSVTSATSIPTPTEYALSESSLPTPVPTETPEPDPIETRPPLEAVMEGVYSYISQNQMTADAQAETVIIEKYNDGLDDAYEIYLYLCNNGICTAIPDGGILVCNLTTGSNYTYNSTKTYAFTAFTLKLDLIDPDTGTVKNFRTFSSEDTHSCSIAYNGLGSSTVQSLMHFNSDMTKLVATLTLENGEVHVGWIDENGKFTDVSKKVSTTSDFGALTKHSTPCFGPDNYFYFRDSTDSSVQVKRVPLDSLNISSVETLISGETWAGTVIAPFPDGTVLDSMYQWYYYDKEMIYPAISGNFYDWISEDECVGVDTAINKNMIYRFKLSGEHDIFHWDSEQSALVPNVKDRKNWNPVVSPERDRVAFLSKLTSGAEQTPYLFIVPLDGGEPMKVTTNYSFAGTSLWLIGWMYV